jgi:hypothetical protein
MRPSECVLHSAVEPVQVLGRGAQGRREYKPVLTLEREASVIPTA